MKLQTSYVLLFITAALAVESNGQKSLLRKLGRSNAKGCGVQQTEEDCLGIEEGKCGWCSKMIKGGTVEKLKCTSVEDILADPDEWDTCNTGERKLAPGNGQGNACGRLTADECDANDACLWCSKTKDNGDLKEKCVSSEDDPLTTEDWETCV